MIVTFQLKKTPDFDTWSSPVQLQISGQFSTVQTYLKWSEINPKNRSGFETGFPYKCLQGSASGQ